MIEIENLRKIYYTKSKYSDRKAVPAVRDVSLKIPEGSAISLIGESGCGKTTIGRILCGLETPTSGTIRINGQDMSKLKRKKRGELLEKIQLIHQDPYQALNPSHTIHQILQATLKKMAKRKGKDSGWIKERMEELLKLVGLDPATVLLKYPHMLSGGQRQRIIIARALTVEPEVLVADEAVSMIDVSLRLGILKLLRNLREEHNISILFITHDVAAARYLGKDTQLFVIYKGKISEKGKTDTVINSPHHPYTQSLLSAIPTLRGIEKPGKDRFVLKTEINSNEMGETGCLFADRCPFSQSVCFEKAPELTGNDHDYACYFPEERDVTAKSV
ncbi:MAG TPA: ABC transporter ATP-binding protein [Candidatus Angelobacter sp.]|nr:ABC transporter ATP-binding protein [Candidatus Angelobacter sp.]